MSVCDLVSASDKCSQVDLEYRNLLSSVMTAYKMNKSAQTATELQAVLGWLTTGPSVYEIVSGGDNVNAQFVFWPNRTYIRGSACFPKTVTLVYDPNAGVSCNTGGRRLGNILYGYRNVLDERPISIFYVSPDDYIPPPMQGLGITQPMIVSCYTGIIFDNLLYDNATQILYYRRPATGEILKFKITIMSNLPFSDRKPIPFIEETFAEETITFIEEPNLRLDTGVESLWWSPARFLQMQIAAQDGVFTDGDVILARMRFKKYYNVVPDGRYNMINNATRVLTGIDPIAGLLEAIQRLPIFDDYLLTDAKTPCIDGNNRNVALDIGPMRKTLFISASKGNPFITMQIKDMIEGMDTI